MLFRACSFHIHYRREAQLETFLNEVDGLFLLFFLGDFGDHLRG